METTQQEKIKEFCDTLAGLWSGNVPDWRFGQLIWNTFGELGQDPFFIEDDAMLNKLKEILQRENT